MLLAVLTGAQALTSLTEQFKSRKSFVVSFRMKECEPCDQFEQMFEQARRRLPDAFDIYQIHCDDPRGARLCTRYNVSIAPTAALFNSRGSRRTPVFLDPNERTEAGVEEFLRKNVYRPFHEVTSQELRYKLGDELQDAQAAFIFQVFDTVSARHYEIVQKYQGVLDFYFIHDYDEDAWQELQETELGRKTKYDQFNLLLRYKGQLLRYAGNNEQKEIITWIDSVLAQ